ATHRYTISAAVTTSDSESLFCANDVSAFSLAEKCGQRIQSRDVRPATARRTSARSEYRRWHPLTGEAGVGYRTLRLLSPRDKHDQREWADRVPTPIRHRLPFCFVFCDIVRRWETCIYRAAPFAALRAWRNDELRCR